MAITGDTTGSGWLVGRSIAMELDMLLTGLLGSDWSAFFQKEFPDVAESIPPVMAEEWQQVFGRTRGWSSLLETLAFLAGVYFEGDYQKATLQMRSLTLSQALIRIRVFGQKYGLKIDPDLPDTQQLMEIGVQLLPALYADLGLIPSNPDTFNRYNLRDMKIMARILSGCDRHDWFWMWLDRLYYEAYRAWRETRFDMMDRKQSKAVMELGAIEKTDQVPETEWLPLQNPLRIEPAYVKAARSGKLFIFFWVDPFGLADNWSLYPGVLAAAFSEPGEMYQWFFHNAQALARRANALADPTRLGILRLIRHFGMINTEIGKFMGISRPTVSIHAKLLREAGLIRSHEEGRETRHEIVPDELKKLFKDLEGFLDLGEESPEEKS